MLFDFGGVLVSSPFETFHRYEADHGLPEGFIRKLNTMDPDANAWARLERAEISFEQFCDQFESDAERAGGKVDARVLFSSLLGEPRPQMLKAAARCHERLKTGLLTNNFLAPGANMGLELAADLFDVVIESSRVGVRKPDPKFYEIACKELEIHPSEAVFLDDLGVNLKPARAMGMATIKVIDPDQALAELEELVGFPLG